jgi:hypothetical protein
VAGPVDVEVIEGEPRPVPYERPSEDVIAERSADGVAWYTFARCGDNVVGRIYRLVDFVIDAGQRRVVYHRDPATDPGLVPILITGTLTAYLLSAQGRLVLHASAVEAGGAAIAFVGFSGQGKTTMAALLCADGHPLVTDDLLPVEVQGGQATCVPAGTELRVRDKVKALVDSFAPQVPRRATADDRQAVAAPPTLAERLPLGAIVVPWPDREAGKVRTRRLSAGEAVMTLARYQRIEGWTSALQQRDQFEAISATVESVPVLDMHVPWGPPFPVALAAQVIAASGLAQAPVVGTP